MAADLQIFHTTAPARIDFAGGPSDLPIFRSTLDGAVLNATIELFAHVVATRHSSGFMVSSDQEGEISGPQSHELRSEPSTLICSCLQLAPPITGWHFRVTSEIPVGAGLSSSSAVGAAVIAAALNASGSDADPLELAQLVASAESDYFGRPAGLQDPIAVALGGVLVSSFAQQEALYGSRRLAIPIGVLHELQDQFLLFDSLIRRSSSRQLDRYRQRVKEGDVGFIRSIARLARLANECAEHLAQGDLDAFLLTMRAVSSIENSLDELRVPPLMAQAVFEFERLHPDVWAKIPGAGGGGCLLVRCPAELKESIRSVADNLNLRHIPFGFSSQGACVEPS